MKTLKKTIILVFSSVLLALAFPCFAGDTGIDGFNALFFRPNVDGEGILNVDTANTLYPGVAYAGGYFQYARRPVSFSDPALGGLTTDLVENQVLMDVVMGVGLFDFLDFGLDVPIALMQNGTNCGNATCTAVSSYSGAGVGDMRFVFKLRLLEDKKGSVGVALASDIGIPTGNKRLFTGGNNASYEQRLIVSKRFKHVEVAANVGYRVVDRVDAIGITYDDMLTFGAGVKGYLPHHLYAYGTIAGNAYLTNSSSATTPVEFMGGIGHEWKNHVSCDVGGGARINDGVTAADYRVMGNCGIKFGLTKSARDRLNPNSEINSPPLQWTIPMATNQWKLTLQQKEEMEDVIRWLTADGKRKVAITGNADDRALYDYNMNLSTKRALAARDYLVGHGVAPRQIVIVTNGEALPVSAGKSETDRGRNRSIVIREVRN
jgi:hypothetical protein